MSTPAYAQLVDTNTESDPEEAPLEAEESQPLGSRVPLMSEEFEASEPSGTRTVSSHSLVSSNSTAPLSPDHPLTHVSPTPTSTRVLFHHRIARMAVHTKPTLSPGMSAHIAEAAALSPSSFWDKLGDEDTKEDESLDADDERERSDDEGHGLGDDDHGLDDETASEPLGLGYEALRRCELAEEEDQVPSTFEVGQSSRYVPEQQGAERVSPFRQPTLNTWVDLEDGRVYTDIPAYVPLAAPVQTPPSPDWSLSSLPVLPSSPIVPSPIASLVATPTATWASPAFNINRDVRELYTRSGAVRDEIFLHRYRFRCLEPEQERATVTFGALWRQVLALEAWAGHVATRLEDMSRARYDDHRLIHDMLVQQAAMQHELQEMRGHVTALEQERSRRGQ
ncbi:hypothetical protein Tco_0650928 [Tanacetum coccineum]